MRLIKPSYEILTPIDGNEILKTIEKVARTCYKSEDKITENSAEKMIKSLISRGHEAMIEFFDITIKYTCDRGVSHELVRHRLANFAQESTRYVSYNKEKQGSQITVIDIENVMRLKIGSETIHPISKEKVIIDEKIMLEWFDEWNIAMNEAERHYMNMTNNCCPPELARSVLPNSTKTEINVKMNLRELRLFFKLRTSAAAHPQMRELTRPLLDELKTKIPIIFDDISY
jgi:thymidylate synthase (FAD)